MNNNKLHFLAKTADILVKELDAFDLVKELKEALKGFGLKWLYWPALLLASF